MSIPSTQRAVVAEKAGGPEVLEYRTDHAVPQPTEGQVLVKNEIAGINYIDTYFRTGLYPSPKPEVLGREAAGIIVALGPGTDEYDLKVGDRVIWLANAGYAEYSAVPAAKTLRLPDALSYEDATASFMSGLTVLALAKETYTVKPGDWVLLHAAAGGAGFLMTQLLKHMGAHVIGTAGGPEKVELVKSLGADHVIDYRSDQGKDWVTAVLNITGGRGVDVVYDSVGQDTWQGSLAAVKRKGTVVWFGNSSGPIPPLPLKSVPMSQSCWSRIESSMLTDRVSLLSPKCVKIARPTLFGYIATRDEFAHYANELFGLLTSGTLKVRIHGFYSLSNIQQAHIDLESRKTSGKLLIKVSE
jgi:NADPH2:quinone reductase